jgi:hypothetical protein
MSTGQRVDMRRIPPSVDESILRMVENLACRLAERSQGRITPCHLIPYMPLPLELIRTCLDDMVDGESVVSPPGEERVVYEFTANRNFPGAPEGLSMQSCVACGTPLLRKAVSVFCASCAETLYRAAERMAVAHGWVQQAQIEHALLYAAAPYAGEPVSIATLASRSHTQNERHPAQFREDGLRLIREVSFPGTYALWFFTNDSLWKRYAIAHYSRTQLQGISISPARHTWPILLTQGITMRISPMMVSPSMSMVMATLTVNRNIFRLTKWRTFMAKTMPL